MKDLLIKIKKYKLLTLFFVVAGFIHLNGQVIVEYGGNGTYSYTSLLPASHLHFYLFDDGYHSFDQNPTHQFSNINTPATPVLFHTGPYEIDIPEEENIGGGGQGNSNPTITLAEMENQVQIKRSWNLVEGQENYFILMFENTQSNAPIDGCVEFHYNNNDNTIISADILDDYNGWVDYLGSEPSEYTSEDYTHKLVWEFSDLEPDEQRFIYIPALCNQPAFSTIKNCGVLKTDCDEPLPYIPYRPAQGPGQNDSPLYELTSLVSNFPHDPNCIVPYCVDEVWGDTGNGGGLKIKYRIYFQNDGTDPVEDVVISTTIDQEFDNVTLLDASDNCTLWWGPGAVEIEFEDIYLPGSGMIPPPLNYDMTVGWVEFLVCFSDPTTLDFINDETCIDQKASIFFDNLAPIDVQDEYCRNQWAYCLGQHHIPEHLECGDGKVMSYQEYDPENNPGNNPDSDSPITEDLGGHVNLDTNENLIAIDMDNATFEIYPNPTKEGITIIGLSNYDESKIVVRNIEGRIINVQTVMKNNGQVQLDVNAIEAGVYMISVYSLNGLSTKRFVKL